MATKTQKIIENSNYFLKFKESTTKENSSQACEVYGEVLKDLSDIFGNQVKNGLKTPEEIETFYSTLPNTEEMFEQPGLHHNLGFTRDYFNEVIKIRQAEMDVLEQEDYAKVA